MVFSFIFSDGRWFAVTWRMGPHKWSCLQLWVLFGPSTRSETLQLLDIRSHQLSQIHLLGLEPQSVRLNHHYSLKWNSYLFIIHPPPQTLSLIELLCFSRCRIQDIEKHHHRPLPSACTRVISFPFRWITIHQPRSFPFMLPEYKVRDKGSLGNSFLSKAPLSSISTWTKGHSYSPVS